MNYFSGNTNAYYYTCWKQISIKWPKKIQTQNYLFGLIIHERQTMWMMAQVDS